MGDQTFTRYEFDGDTGMISRCVAAGTSRQPQEMQVSGCFVGRVDRCLSRVHMLCTLRLIYLRVAGGHDATPTGT